MKGAHQVFAGFQVDADFAADRTVHLRQQGGGRLDERDAAQINRGEKSGQIPHHAATQGDEEGFPFQAVRGQLVAGGLDHFEAFGSFAVRHANQPRFKPGGTESGQSRLGVEARHPVVGNDRAAAAEFPFGGKSAQLGKQTGSHKNGIAAMTQWDGDGAHGCCHFTILYSQFCILSVRRYPRAR